MSSPKRLFFSYQPLVGHDPIRLVLLHPALDVLADVECSIEHATLSQYDQDLINHYTALSYVWGEPTDTRQIIVEGCAFHITATLESALRHLRDTKSVIRVWADALCINQTDIQEKSQQVSKMGTVYSVARHTVIYLGDSSEKTDSIFSELEYFGTSGNVPLPRADLRSKYNDATLNVLADGLQSHILGRSWFTRVWVFQELLLSRDPWLQCGSKRLKWESLCLFLRLLRFGDEPVTFIKTEPDFLRVHLLEGVDAIGRLQDMISARHRYQDYIVGKDAGNPLLTLLALRRGLGVSDARDMIYAHLGIVSDSGFGHLELEVDYSKSYPELFIDVTRYFLKRYNDYRILSHVEDVDPLKQRQGLPSWVPDWTSIKILDPDRNGSFVPDRGHVDFSFLQSAEGKHQLVCKGKLITRIGMLGSNVLSFAHLCSDEVRRSWSTYLEIRDKRKGFEVLIEEAAETAGLQISPSFQKNLIHCQDHYEKVLERIRTPSTRGGSPSEVKIHPVALISAVLFSLVSASPSYVGADQAGLQVLEGKRLCLLKDLACVKRPESDEIALVPQSTQVGDFICSLDGEWRNFVFRPIKNYRSFEKEIASDHFMFVGRCYYHQTHLSDSNAKTFVLQ